MEEQKIQSLHDTLAKLKKTAGLGIASHYNFGKVKTKQVNGANHMETLNTMNNFGNLYLKMGRFDEAEGFLVVIFTIIIISTTITIIILLTIITISTFCPMFRSESRGTRNNASIHKN